MNGQSASTIGSGPAIPQAPALEVDIILYAGALFRAWKLITGAAILSACLVAGYCLTLPDIFEAFVRTNIVDGDDPGGIKPDERRASEVLTLVEHGFIMGSSRDNFLAVTLARLRSRQFTAEFMATQGVYQAFYADHWDEQHQVWHEGFEVDKAEAYRRFSEDVRFIEHNPETDIITVRMRWTNPQQARQWANAYVAEFNQHIRQKTLAEVERKQSFLRAELEKSDVVDIEKSIYRLIEAQTAIAMLANSRDEYALEVIDPATVPYDRYSPAPKRLTGFGFVAGAMFACFVVIARVLFTRLASLLPLLRAPTLPHDGERQ